MDEQRGRRGCSPIREGVVNIKPDTMMEDILRYVGKVYERWGRRARRSSSRQRQRITNNESYAIKHDLKMFADLASATLKQVADWFVWLASTLGKFNANELRRADHEVHDIADGRYDGRIQKYQQGLTR